MFKYITNNYIEILKNDLKPCVPKQHTVLVKVSFLFITITKCLILSHSILSHSNTNISYLCRCGSTLPCWWRDTLCLLISLLFMKSKADKKRWVENRILRCHTLAGLQHRQWKKQLTDEAVIKIYLSWNACPHLYTLSFLSLRVSGAQALLSYQHPSPILLEPTFSQHWRTRWEGRKGNDSYLPSVCLSVSLCDCDVCFRSSKWLLSVFKASYIEALMTQSTHYICVCF